MQTDDAMLERLLDLCDSVAALTHLAFDRLSRPTEPDGVEACRPFFPEASEAGVVRAA